MKKVAQLCTKTTLALAISLSLTGCFLEGDNGEVGAIGIQGVAGTDGASGTEGANGIDANASITLGLVGRIQLNSDDPEGAAEIVQFHSASSTIYAINSAADEPTIEIIDASTLTSDVLANPLSSENLTSFALVLPTEQNSVQLAGPTSLTVSGNWMAVAMPAADKATNGMVLYCFITGLIRHPQLL